MEGITIIVTVVNNTVLVSFAVMFKPTPTETKINHNCQLHNLLKSCCSEMYCFQNTQSTTVIYALLFCAIFK